MGAVVHASRWVIMEPCSASALVAEEGSQAGSVFGGRGFGRGCAGWPSSRRGGKGSDDDNEAFEREVYPEHTDASSQNRARANLSRVAFDLLYPNAFACEGCG